MEENRRKLMALDVGDKRIGVAVSDELSMFAHPRPGIKRGGGEEYLAVVALANNEKVRQIVVGLPLELSGEVGPQAQKVLKFTETVRKRLNSAGFSSIEIVTWDERLTTVEAERHLVGKKQLKDVRRREALDQVAAVVLLESYLANAANVDSLP